MSKPESLPNYPKGSRQPPSVIERISVKIYKNGWVHVRGKYAPQSGHNYNEDQMKFIKTFVSVKMFLASYGFRILGVATGKKVYPEIMALIEEEISQSCIELRTVLVDFVRVSDEHEKWSGDSWQERCDT